MSSSVEVGAQEDREQRAGRTCVGAGSGLEKWGLAAEDLERKKKGRWSWWERGTRLRRGGQRGVLSRQCEWSGGVGGGW